MCVCVCVCVCVNVCVCVCVCLCRERVESIQAVGERKQVERIWGQHRRRGCGSGPEFAIPLQSMTFALTKGVVPHIPSALLASPPSSTIPWTSSTQPLTTAASIVNHFRSVIYFSVFCQFAND